MAGNYPNSPSWRMAYDRDGTQGYRISSANVVTPLTSGDMANLNDEDTDLITYNDSVAKYLMFWFPEVRDLDAFWINAGGSNSYEGVAVMLGAEVSADTTNGIDGTWTSVWPYQSRSGSKPSKPNYRTSIVSLTALGIRAVRFQLNSNGAGVGYSEWHCKNLHLYGEPVPGANPDRLALWHPTLDQRIVPSHFDWGDVPRSSSADKQFRVKNLSTTKTANSVRVAQEVLTDADTGLPSVPAQHTLSTDGATFLAQVNVGTLGPGTLSSVVTLRRVTPSNAQLGLWSHRVFAEANTWS